ncbi:ankyrin repeat domain-containing protein [Nocardia sp. NPDC127526]|uniref:ankyrin repeat domain-containing protein n=1 Tax=Nocardia sp. NPDC127526 TaxID=3345393 RepID=UPI003639F4B5
MIEQRPAVLPPDVIETFLIDCGAEVHVVGWQRGELRAFAHDPAEVEREQAMAALGSLSMGCYSLFRGEGYRLSLNRLLRSSIEHETLDVVAELVRAGADPHSVSKSGKTALSTAITAGLPDLVRDLLTAGVDVQRHLIAGETPLQFAVRLGRAEIVRLLLDAGADPHAHGADPTWPTPLDLVLEGRCAACRMDVLRASLRKDESLLLERAARTGDAALAREALAAGADPRVQDSLGITPLHIAVSAGSVPVVQVLIGAGADPNVQTLSGKSSLYVALFESRAWPAPVLLAAGADTGIRGAEGTVLHAAALRDAVKAIDLLMGYGTDVDARDDAGRTPLHIAAAHGRVAATRKLLAAGADPDARAEDGDTALHVAVRGKQLATARELIAAGADIHAETAAGRTALALAIAERRGRIVMLLRAAGAR